MTSDLPDVADKIFVINDENFCFGELGQIADDSVSPPFTMAFDKSCIKVLSKYFSCEKRAHLKNKRNEPLPGQSLELNKAVSALTICLF